MEAALRICGESRIDGRKLVKIYVIGLGPGDVNQMTPRAFEALRKCDVIAGYDLYISLIREHITGKEIISTPMKGEIDRCVAARDRALENKTIAVVSSGDAGVYGMAGLVYEVCRDYPQIDIEVIAGITAACAGGALLGAPLNHDFALISLSDLLTPWEKIETRLDLSAQADFCICLYNPSSVKRWDYLKRACKIMLRSKAGSTPCGIARNIGRGNESVEIYTLEQLQEVRVDMFTTVFIGNSQTKVLNGKLMTPRGYECEKL